MDNENNSLNEEKEEIMTDILIKDLYKYDFIFFYI